MYHKKFDFIGASKAGDFQGHRQAYASMVNFMDGVIANITSLLQARKMWNTTLYILSSDNGGPIYRNGSVGANNFPLRSSIDGRASTPISCVHTRPFSAPQPLLRRVRRSGGKASNWDGARLEGGAHARPQGLAAPLQGPYQLRLGTVSAAKVR